MRPFSPSQSKNHPAKRHEMDSMDQIHCDSEAAVMGTDLTLAVISEKASAPRWGCATRPEFAERLGQESKGMGTKMSSVQLSPPILVLQAILN
jgi:hypothetical protein